MSMECKGEKYTMGTLYGVGIGAGDPKLLTYQAVECIKKCNIIAIPNSGTGNFVAYDIVVQAIPELVQKEIIKIFMPMTKDKVLLEKYHKEGSKIILQYLQNNDVAFLTLGDPSIYATYMYIHKKVKENGKQVKMISGIPSFCAVSSTLGISLTESDEMLHIIPASYGIEYALSLSGTKVLMKVGKSFQNIKQFLLHNEHKFDCYMVENCGMKTEKKYFSLKEFPDNTGYFTTIIIKDKKVN
ncbi:precorrin-2 C(20)-methyltransferase [Clostridium sp. MD294]|uniref:precorrin-2 C(20)-methyltransferase n=1 Tax=Clostridium sp. MD294 TaxID=97138 RepID=UPI0002CA2F51|nr:precorrin-2 C(20)-methyltransferase [Clostridium sp. MD294]USF30638.1 Precorrin-2 C(20)-methyltransferase [Clostridium sp. MD294]